MATLNLQVGASNGDAREDTFLESTTINDTSIYQQNTFIWAGQQFTNVTIQQGATINTATLQLYLFEGDGSRDDAHFDCYCDDVDDAAVFTTSYPDISDRTKTTAYADVDEDNAGGPGWYSITMTTAVQEVINRGSFASGNAIACFQEPTAGIDWKCYAYDGDTAKAGKLDIDYVLPRRVFVTQI